MDYPVTLVSQLKQHLRSLRKASGLTQADLARRLGVVQSRVADIEANPGSISVEQLLHVLTLLNAQVVLRDQQAPAGEGVAPSAKATVDKTSPSQGQW